MRRILLLLIVLAGLAFVARATFRTGGEPVIDIRPAAPAIGKRTGVEIEVSEPTRGLVSIDVEVVQGDRAVGLASKRWSPASAWALSGKKTEREVVRVEVGRETVKSLQQGSAILRVTAGRAGTWLRNPGPVRKELTLPVRLTPPSVQLLSSFTYVSQGGSEAVVYRVGETATRSGVRAGEWFFPGYPLPGGAPNDRFALFAVPYDMESASGVQLVASDEIGNESTRSFIDKFFPTKLQRDTIPLNDAFMNKVVPEILSQTPELTDRGALLENFLQINRDLRRTNNATLRELASSSKPGFLWSHKFQLLDNAAIKARFADRRSYVYQGKTVDQQDHLGLDIAKTRSVPVPAANDGVVVLAKYFGIYGNAVVVDHGFGLMSLYGHLSSIDVKEGQAVRRGESLGRTGETGLAGGDHLHFTLLLHGLAVTPIEWIDGHWIHDRIAAKLGSAMRFED